MGHTTKHKSKLIVRMKRIRGQMAAVERALEEGTDCAEVLQLVAEGRNTKEIAEILHISPRTVEFHRHRIMDALGLHGTAELVQYAIKHRIISS